MEEICLTPRLHESGYFASLMLPENTQDTFLGGSLGRHERRNTVEGLAIYLRHSR